MTEFVTQQGILLVPEHPLQVLPALAVEIGLNETIAVQQLHYWTQRSKDNEGWVYNTMTEWREQFPFWSVPTIKRIWRSLRDQGLVETKQRGGTDRTNHYRLIYSALPMYRFPSDQSDPIVGSKRAVAPGQNDPMSNNNSETTQRTPLPPEGGRRRKKVNRQPVTDAEYELAAGIVGAFNEIADTRYETDAQLVKVVGRIREKPDLTIDDHRAIIVAAFADPHWKGHPAPAVVYGNAAVFESCAESCRAKRRPQKPKRDRSLAKLAERDQ